MTSARRLVTAAICSFALVMGVAAAVAVGPLAATRTVLGSGTPPTTGDDELALFVVRIPRGTTIAPHTHPGLEIAQIRTGDLAYRVIRGRATVRRESGRTIVLRSGSSTILRAGDTVTEPKGMVHRAQNRGRRTVVVVIASLFPKGAPVSNPASP